MCVQIQHEILSIFIRFVTKLTNLVCRSISTKTIAPVLAEYEVLKSKK